ncbi:hypothetical protein NDU88_003210 [Pleurodeles waltl]|uniref:Uncharacterized protein n=1 Tax=Pleurodeles waltl TaxID=8319 RepID=A0AAV7KXW6_PLEWA|nr:hypothetical protein NDU88_003210 [Pleurodeles waltl]
MGRGDGGREAAAYFQNAGNDSNRCEQGGSTSGRRFDTYEAGLPRPFKNPISSWSRKHRKEDEAPAVLLNFYQRNQVRSVIRWVIYDVRVAVAGLAEIVRMLPHVLKISMAPKAARNSGDKSDGSKMTHIGRVKGDKGDLAGVNRRPASTAGKLTRKNMSGPGKDAKISDNTIPLLEGRAPSAQSATSSIEEQQNGPPNPKGWDKITEKDLNTSDWAKDSSDKFYSLTEESDVSSRELSFSETGSSETSETGNKSSSNEPTVRQLQRHRKCTKVRPDSQEGLEFSTSTGSRTLKWDYSGIRLTDTPTTSGQELVNNNMEGSTGDPASSMCLAVADSGMLQSIYNSIKELQTETRIESRRARVATKRLQGTVRKVAKSCRKLKPN